MQYHVRGLPEGLGGTVRETMRSPQYGHPAVRELAGGTGPCRICLRRFDVGAEDRILFTYQPATGDGSVGAPGPVFIHAGPCAQYHGAVFPPDLQSLPVIIEGHGTHGRVPHAVQVAGSEGNNVRLRERGDNDFGMET